MDELLNLIVKRTTHFVATNEADAFRLAVQGAINEYHDENSRVGGFSPQDVIDKALESFNMELTEEQGKEILLMIDDDYDCENGVNWYTVWDAIHTWRIRNGY